MGMDKTWICDWYISGDKSGGLCKVCVALTDHVFVTVVVFILYFVMEVNSTNMLLIVVAVAFMFILTLLTLGALCYIAEIVNGFTNFQPTRQLVVQSHNCPPGTSQLNNTVNLTACTHNQRRPPEENDERFCQTVGMLKSKKFDRLIKT